MSERTAKANNAVRLAWINEQKLVAEGKGTRDWNQEQQRSILERGKAYDENGKAFQGHHMKSVELFPEYQDAPENIQLLSKSEHFNAHKGNWRTPSNWFYNPKTNEYIEFNDGELIPCKTTVLSEPLYNKLKTDNYKVTTETAVTKDNNSLYISTENANKLTSSKGPIPHTKHSNKLKRISFSRITPIANKQLKKIGKVAPLAIAIGPPVIDLIITIAGGKSGRKTTTTIKKDPIVKNTSQFAKMDATKRISPRQHTVKSHGQHYGKNKVWVVKSSYTRGGKSD